MGVNSVNNSLLTALSGIQTAQALLNTTSRNITNAQTPGYVVKNQQAVSNAATGGVLAGSVQRFIDAALQQKLRTNNGDAGFTQVRADALTKLNQLSGDPQQGTSISAKINDLLGTFQELSANPQDAAVAENVLNSAHDLAQTFNEQTDQIFQVQQTALSNVVTQTAQVNADLQAIATFNQQVASAQANGRDPTDLQDQRDNAVNDLSKLIGVNAFIDNQGILQVLSSDYHPLAGLYAEVLTFNQVTNQFSVSGHTITNIGGQLGGNQTVATVDTEQRLQNLSEVANQLTSAFQALPTTTIGLNGQLAASSPAAFAADITVPGVTKLITDNGSQYSANLVWRATGTSTSTYQLVASNLSPIEGAPAVSIPAYSAGGAGTQGSGGLVLGTVDMSTNPPTFNGNALSLTPTVANTTPGKIDPLIGMTTGLSAGAGTPTSVTANNTMTLFVQSDGHIPRTTMTLTGTLPAAAAFPGDSASSAAFTLTTDLGNQYNATLAYRPSSTNASTFDVVISSLTPIGNAPAAGNLAYNAAASTGGIVIGSFDTSQAPPTFHSNEAISDIPAHSSAPSLFPGHIEPISASSTVAIAAGVPTVGAITATNDVTAPFYSGNIELNPTITARALQVGDQFANTVADTNVGAANAAAQTLLNRQFTFDTLGIAGNQTLQVGSGAVTIGIGQQLANANNSIVDLTTANTQIQQAIAPQSEVNLDNEMSKLVVLQNLYQANARVVSTVSQLLDTLINLPT
jgi:flagellar hook-associated protein 1 FlgK